MPPIMNLRAARKSLFHNTSNFMQTLRGTPPRREGQAWEAGRRGRRCSEASLEAEDSGAGKNLAHSGPTPEACGETVGRRGVAFGL